jgi:hypothetical protein
MKEAGITAPRFGGRYETTGLDKVLLPKPAEPKTSPSPFNNLPNAILLARLSYFQHAWSRFSRLQVVTLAARGSSLVS